MRQRLTTPTTITFTAAIVVVLGMMALSGCERAEPPQWEISAQAAALRPELVTALTGIVQEHSGTALKPELVTDTEMTFDEQLHLKHGQRVYLKRCVQCHGVSGDGNGPVARHMYPRPRDYTRGIFKFTSTVYGARPRREDLTTTLKRGITGTSMPAFNLLPSKDLEAVADYVLVLSQRGELEFQLATEASNSDELDPDYVPELVGDVRVRWSAAESGLTQPLTPQPELTPERIALGREAFLTKGCSKCHGDDGRGHTKDNIGKDSWGHATRAADLTSGMLRGGHDPVDVYRRIMNGINGTPMPGFRSALETEPETIWNLVSYVLSVSGRRRAGESIPAGLIKPYGEPPGDQSGVGDASAEPPPN